VARPRACSTNRFQKSRSFSLKSTMARLQLLPTLNSDDEGPEGNESSDEDEMDNQFEFGGILVSGRLMSERTFSSSALRASTRQQTKPFSKPSIFCRRAKTEDYRLHHYLLHRRLDGRIRLLSTKLKTRSQPRAFQDLILRL
jgi:hypothetical protein